MSKMKIEKLKNKLAVAMTVTLLALPLSTASTLADTITPSSTTAPTATSDASVPTTVTPATTTSGTTTSGTTTSGTTTSGTTTSGTTTSGTTTSGTATSDTTTPVVDSSGNTVTPDNWLEDLIGKLQIALTFNPVRKAELYEQHALANLAEAQKLMKEDKPENAQVALNQYTDKIDLAQQFLNQVKDPNSEEAKNLVIALSKVNSNNIQVLSGLLDKLPPQAAQKLALNVVRAMEKAVNKIEEGTTTASGTSATTTTTTTAAATSSATTTPTSSTTPTAIVDQKTLEKQAKKALEDFKKSLNQSGKVHLEDNDQDNEQVTEQDKDQDIAHTQNQTPAQKAQSEFQNQSTHVTVPPTPVKQPLVPADTHSSENKDGMHNQTENGHEKGDHEVNHRDK